ncbi:MAG: hypothetical protein ACLS5G_07615 [Streptococcus sp.]
MEVLESMDIVSEFPEDVMAEAEAVPDAPVREDLLGRVDLRQEVTLLLMELMLRTWMMRSILNVCQMVILAWCSYCRCVLLCH